MRSKGRVAERVFPGLRSETWGTQVCAFPPFGQKTTDGWGTQVCAFPPIGHKTTDGWGTQGSVNVLQDCACLRERSGWRWELSFI
jgi:hypothetical protein